MGVPGVFIYHYRSARKPGFSRHLNSLRTPTAKSFITNTQFPVFLPGHHKTRPLKRHGRGNFSLALGALCKVPKILEVGLGIKTIRNGIRASFGLPENVASSFFSAFLARAGRSLIPPVSVFAYPIEGVQIFHQRSHCPIVMSFDGFKHFSVKSLVESAVGVNLHYILCLA